MADPVTTPPTDQTTPPSNGAETQTPPPGSTTENSPGTTSASASTDLGGTNDVANEDADLGTDPTGASTEGDKPPVPEFFGAPTNEDGTPADYADFTLPEGSVADPELKESFSGLAKKLGLNQKGAQELVSYKAQLDQKAIKDWTSHLETVKAAAKADPEIGGAKYAESVTLGRAVIAKFNPKLTKVMNDYGVGAHPEMIRFMANIARATGETPSGGTGGSGGSVEKPLHELFYGDDRSKQGT
jgi:hypothetical protein